MEANLSHQIFKFKSQIQIPKFYVKKIQIKHPGYQGQ